LIRLCLISTVESCNRFSILNSENIFPSIIMVCNKIISSILQNTSCRILSDKKLEIASKSSKIKSLMYNDSKFK